MSIQTNRGRISINLSWLLANRLLRMAIGVFVMGYIGRFLGPPKFGLLNYAISLTAIVGALASLSFEGIVIREMVRVPEETSTILGTAFFLRIAGAFLAIGFAMLCSIALGTGPMESRLTLIIAASFLPQACEVVELWFQKELQAKQTTLPRMLATFAGLALRVILVQTQASLVWFAWALVADAGFNAFAMIVLARKHAQSALCWRFSRSVAAMLVRDCWPLILSATLVAVYTRIEQVLVMKVLGSGVAGTYFASTRIIEVIFFVPAVILASVYPILVQKRKQDPGAYGEKLQLVFDALTGFGYMAAILVTCAAPFAIPLIYGSKYLPAVPILVVQAWALPFIFSGSARGHYLLLENLNLFHTVAAILGILTNLCLSLFLMPRIGAIGAAVASLAGYAISAYGCSFLFERLRPCAALQTKSFLLAFRLPAFFRSLKNKHEH